MEIKTDLVKNCRDFLTKWSFPGFRAERAMKKSTSENRSAFLGVGAEGVEPPTLCL